MSILYYKGKRGVVMREDGEKLILVVEDSDVIRNMLARILFKLGVSTDTASDGLEAVEKASTGAYDLILMDLAMPAMDGYEATRRIREAERRFDLPRSVIVAVTAFGTREQCLNAGMDDYVLKPVTTEQMRSLLNRWLAHESRAAAAGRP